MADREINSFLNSFLGAGTKVFQTLETRRLAEERIAVDKEEAQIRREQLGLSRDRFDIEFSNQSELERQNSLSRELSKDFGNTILPIALEHLRGVPDPVGFRGSLTPPKQVGEQDFGSLPLPRPFAGDPANIPQRKILPEEEAIASGLIGQEEGALFGRVRANIDAIAKSPREKEELAQLFEKADAFGGGEAVARFMKLRKISDSTGERLFEKGARGEIIDVSGEDLLTVVPGKDPVLPKTTLLDDVAWWMLSSKPGVTPVRKIRRFSEITDPEEAKAVREERDRLTINLELASRGINKDEQELEGTTEPMVGVFEGKLINIEIGTPIGFARDTLKARPVTPLQLDNIKDALSLEPLIDQMTDISRVINKHTGLRARLQTVVQFIQKLTAGGELTELRDSFGRQLRMGEALGLQESIKDTVAGSFAKAFLGEAGVLSNTDITRVKALFPSGKHTIAEAQFRLDIIKSIYKGAVQAQKELLTGDFSSFVEGSELLQARMRKMVDDAENSVGNFESFAVKRRRRNRAFEEEGAKDPTALPDIPNIFDPAPDPFAPRIGGKRGFGTSTKDPLPTKTQARTTSQIFEQEELPQLDLLRAGIIGAQGREALSSAVDRLHSRLSKGGRGGLFLSEEQINAEIDMTIFLRRTEFEDLIQPSPPSSLKESMLKPFEKVEQDRLKRKKKADAQLKRIQKENQRLETAPFGGGP